MTSIATISPRAPLIASSAAPASNSAAAISNSPVDVYEAPRRKKPTDSATRRQAHQSKNQPSAKETITEARKTLNDLPELVRRQAKLILDNQGLMKALLKNPDTLRGIGKSDPEAMAVARAEMQSLVNRAALEGAYWTGLLSRAEKPLDDLALTFETNDQARLGLLLATELDLPLGEVLSDVRTGVLNEDMLARLMEGTPKACDLASVFLYLREKAGGELILDGTSPTFRALMDTLPINPRVNTDAIEEIRIARDDTIRIKLSESEPLIAGSTFDLGIGSELVLDVEANPTEGRGAFILSPRLPQGTGLKAMFVNLHLHFSGNGTLDQIIEILLKILLSPVLLIAGIAVDATDKRYESKDEVGPSSEI